MGTFHAGGPLGGGLYPSTGGAIGGGTIPQSIGSFGEGSVSQTGGSLGEALGVQSLARTPGLISPQIAPPQLLRPPAPPLNFYTPAYHSQRPVGPPSFAVESWSGPVRAPFFGRVQERAQKYSAPTQQHSSTFNDEYVDDDLYE